MQDKREALARWGGLAALVPWPRSRSPGVSAAFQLTFAPGSAPQSWCPSFILGLQSHAHPPALRPESEAQALPLAPAHVSPSPGSLTAPLKDLQNHPLVSTHCPQPRQGPQRPPSRWDRLLASPASSSIPCKPIPHTEQSPSHGS